jgi:hypothetical protein
MTSTAEGKTHVDAQLSQILELGLELSRQHPARIRRALRTAYAAHFRTLMEFFHDGRPGKKPKRSDWKLSDFIPTGTVNPLRAKWTVQEKTRFKAADQLLGHLSKRRPNWTREGEWVCGADQEMILSCVREMFSLISQVEVWFPRMARLKRCFYP